MVVIFQRFALGGLSRLGDGQGHVRLQGQQTAIQVGKGDDLFRRQKASILLIQPVFLKAAHVVFAASRRLVQRPQRKGCTFLRLQIRQIKLHLDAPPFLDLPKHFRGTFRAAGQMQTFLTLFYFI